MSAFILDTNVSNYVAGWRACTSFLFTLICVRKLQIFESKFRKRKMSSPIWIVNMFLNIVLQKHHSCASRFFSLPYNDFLSSGIQLFSLDIDAVHSRPTNELEEWSSVCHDSNQLAYGSRVAVKSQIFISARSAAEESGKRTIGWRHLLTPLLRHLTWRLCDLLCQTSCLSPNGGERYG